MQAKISERTTTIPQHTLRRLAVRGLGVFERYASEQPVLASVEGSFRPVAEAFVEAYDKGRTGGPPRARELSEAKEAAKALSEAMARWLGWLEKPIQGFNRSSYANKNSATDDIIADAQRLLEVVRNHQASTETPLEFGDALIADVEQALAAATREWAQAVEARETHQRQLSDTRQLAGELQAGLVALRRTLRAVFGKRHAAYQDLRVARVPGDAGPSEDEDSDEPVLGVAVDESESKKADFGAE